MANQGGNQMAGQMVGQGGISQEEALRSAYRDSLEDAIHLLDGLSGLCYSLEDIISILKLALTNDSQLELVRSRVTPKSLRGR